MMQEGTSDKQNTETDNSTVGSNVTKEVRSQTWCVQAQAHCAPEGQAEPEGKISFCPVIWLSKAGNKWQATPTVASANSFIGTFGGHQPPLLFPKCR